MEVQQQKIIPKYKQPDINKLLDAIPSNRIYQSVTGETFPKGTTDDRASYIVPIISTSILGSYGKHVPFLLAAYSMSVKPFDNILHGDSTRVFFSFRKPGYHEQKDGIKQWCTSSLWGSHARIINVESRVAYSAPTVSFAASTTVGSMDPVADHSQNILSKRRNRHRYRSSPSSSDNSDSAPRNTLRCQYWTWSWESKGLTKKLFKYMDISEFRDIPVNWQYWAWKWKTKRQIPKQKP